MKLKLIFSFFIFIVTSSVCFASETTLTYEGIYEIDGVVYKKFTTEPFSGDIKKIPNKNKTIFFGTDRYENGKLVYDEEFHSDGSLWFKRNFKNGVLKDGDYVYYNPNGSIEQTFKIKKGKLIGDRIWFREDGSVVTIFRINKDGTFAQKDFDEDGFLSFSFFGRFNDGFVYQPNEWNYHHIMLWKNASYEEISYYPNGNYKHKFLKNKNGYNGYFDNFHNNGVLSHRRFSNNGEILYPSFDSTLLFKKFPLCSFKTSKGNICKFLNKSEKDNYSFHSFMREKNIQKNTEYFAHFKTDDWNYYFNISMDEENNIQLQLTDESIIGTYFVTQTYGITYSNEKENWVINYETIDYLNGSKEDKKIEGKVTKFNPPIPFIDCIKVNIFGLCLD